MLPSPISGDLPDPGIEIESLVSTALAGGCFTTEPPGSPSGPTLTLIPFVTCRKPVLISQVTLDSLSSVFL